MTDPPMRYKNMLKITLRLFSETENPDITKCDTVLAVIYTVGVSVGQKTAAMLHDVTGRSFGSVSSIYTSLHRVITCDINTDCRRTQNTVRLCMYVRHAVTQRNQLNL